jgi:hypothetical protein
VTALTDDDRRVIARARKLAAALTLDEVRAVTGMECRDTALVDADALALAQHLLGELASIAERPGEVAEDTRRLDAIRGLLARFDWEHGDRQLALEAIDRIAGGDEDQADEPDELDDLEPYCAGCGVDVGIFIGHGDTWLHYTGEGTVESPVELYDAGHAPEVDWRPAGAR